MPDGTARATIEVGLLKSVKAPAPTYEILPPEGAGTGVGVTVGAGGAGGAGALFAPAELGKSRMACAVIAALPLVAAYVGDAVPAEGAATSAKASVKPSFVERVSKRRFKPFATLMVGAEPDCAP